MPSHLLVAIDTSLPETQIAYLRDGAIQNFGVTALVLRGWEEGEEATPYLALDQSSGPAPAGSTGVELRVVERGGDFDSSTSPYGDLVLVHHALRKIVKGPGKVRLVTALPFDAFFVYGTFERDQPAIDRRKVSLTKDVIAVERWSHTPLPVGFEIITQGVYPQTLSAFFNGMIRMSSDGAAVLDEAFASRFTVARKFALVDVGALHTHIVFGTWNGLGCDAPSLEHSEILNEGSHHMAMRLAEIIKSRFNLRRVADAQRALSTRQVSIFGASTDIGNDAQAVTALFFEKIKSILSTYGVENLILAGGADLLRENIVETFGAETIAGEGASQYATVTGMLKLEAAFVPLLPERA